LRWGFAPLRDLRLPIAVFKGPVSKGRIGRVGIHSDRGKRGKGSFGVLLSIQSYYDQ